MKHCVMGMTVARVEFRWSRIKQNAKRQRQLFLEMKGVVEVRLWSEYERYGNHQYRNGQASSSTKPKPFCAIQRHNHSHSATRNQQKLAHLALNNPTSTDYLTTCVCFFDVSHCRHMTQRMT
eukprot:m.143063 g.143063  ORF g.143063 m.143063 type:complete len:122 (-) comp14078_c0_seq2:9-374(-)